MKSKAINYQRYWAYFVGLLLPLAVILAPSYQTNLAEHMFTKSFVLQVLIAAATVFYIVTNLGSQIRYSFHPLSLVLYFTIMVGVVSIFWAENKGFAVTQTIKWISGLLLAFLVFQVNEKHNQRLILQLFMLGAMLLALIGIIQYLFEVDLVKQAAKPASTFANKNMAAQIAVLTWPIGSYLFFSDEKVKGKNSNWLAVNAIGVALLLTFIFYTQTQAAWLSVLAQLILIALIFVVLKIKKSKLKTFTTNHKKHSLVAIIVLLILTNLSNDGIKPFWEKIQQGADKIVTRAENTEGNQATIRFQLWQGTIEMAKSNPAQGVGIGNYYHQASKFSNARTHTIRSSHNDYLQSIAELGVVSIALMAATWILLGFVFFSSLLKSGANKLRELFLIVAIGGMAITSIFSFPLQLQTPILLISSYLAILLSGFEVKSFAAVAKKALMVVSLVVAIVIILLNFAWNSKLNEFNQKVGTNDWKQQINFDTGAYSYHPMFKWFSQRVSREYMYSKPGSAVQAANSYLPLAPNDAVIINNKIYGLIKLKRYEEAADLIEKVREFEPEGYYRSYYNELILLTDLNQPEKLKAVLDLMDKEAFGLLSMKPETLDNMSVAAHKLNLKQRAIDYLKRNIEVHPNYLKSYDKIIRMLQGVGNTELANEYKVKLDLLKAD